MITSGVIDTATLGEGIEASAAAGTEHEASIERGATAGERARPMAEVVVYVAAAADGGSLRGKVLAAEHDDWLGLASLGGAIANSDWTTLRRLDPVTPGQLPPQHRRQP